MNWGDTAEVNQDHQSTLSNRMTPFGEEQLLGNHLMELHNLLQDNNDNLSLMRDPMKIISTQRDYVELLPSQQTLLFLRSSSFSIHIEEFCLA